MNWYKRAQSNKKALSRLHKPDLSNVPKKRIKLWNYLKSQNIKHTFYHGTAEKIYDGIQKTGYMMSPAAMNSEHYERRKKGLDQIFYTTSILYAEEYAIRSSQQTNSNPVILKLEIPVYLITEVRNAILYPDKLTYNEFNIDELFKGIINQDMTEDGILKILDHSLFKSLTSEEIEFTTYLALPEKYITNKIEVSSDGKLNNLDIDEWKSIILSDIEYIKKVPPKMLKEVVIERLKYRPYETDHVWFPENLINDPDILKAVEEGRSYLIEKNPINYRIMDLDTSEEKEAFKRGYLNVLIDNPSEYTSTHFPEDLKNDPDILLARKNGWIKRILKDPIDPWVVYLPKDLKEDPDIIEAKINGWKNLLMQAPYLYNNPLVPPSLLKDPEILERIKQQTIKNTKLIMNWYKRANNL